MATKKKAAKAAKKAGGAKARKPSARKPGAPRPFKGGQLFGLNKQNCMLVDVNPRRELHGDKQELAADIKFSAKITNKVLTMFGPMLRPALYARTDPNDADLADGKDHMPVLRFPQIGPLSWKKKYKDRELVISINDKDVKFKVASVDKITLDCQEGGTVVFTFMTHIYPTEEQVAKCCSMIGQEVAVTIPEREETEAEEVPDPDEEEDKGKGAKAATKADPKQSDLIDPGASDAIGGSVH